MWPRSYFGQCVFYSSSIRSVCATSVLTAVFMNACRASFAPVKIAELVTDY